MNSLLDQSDRKAALVLELKTAVMESANRMLWEPGIRRGSSSWRIKTVSGMWLYVQLTRDRFKVTTLEPDSRGQLFAHASDAVAYAEQQAGLGDQQHS